MLRNAFYDDFENADDYRNTNNMHLRAHGGWTVSPLGIGSAVLKLQESGIILQGIRSVSVEPDASGVATYTRVFTDILEAATNAYELEWTFQFTAAGFLQASGIGTRVEGRNQGGSAPWTVEMFRDQVIVTDNSGPSASVFNPGTGLHTYRMISTAGGALDLLIDTVSQFTGTAIAVSPTDVDRIALILDPEATQPLTGTFDIISFQYDVATTFNMGKLFVGS